MTGASVLRMTAICSPTSSIVHLRRYTPGVSAMNIFAMRPAMEIRISPVIEQDS